jgi:hypothetical protein
MAVPSREPFPVPPLAEKIIDTSNPYVTSAWENEGWAEEVIPFVEGIYKTFNEEHGTNLKFNLPPWNRTFGRSKSVSAIGRLSPVCHERTHPHCGYFLGIGGGV